MPGLRDARPGWPRRRAHMGSAAPGRGWVAWLRPEIGQLPDAVTGALPRAWEGRGPASARGGTRCTLTQRGTWPRSRPGSAQRRRSGLGSPTTGSRLARMQREATLTARPSALAGTAMRSGLLEGISARMSSPVLVRRGDHMGALEAAWTGPAQAGHRRCLSDPGLRARDGRPRPGVIEQAHHWYHAHDIPWALMSAWQAAEVAGQALAH